MDRQKRLLIVEDHPLVAEGLALALRGEPDLEVVGVASSVAEAMELAGTGRPTIVLADLHLPDGSGAALVRTLQSHDPKLTAVMLSADSSDAALRESVRAGALGYVLKTQPTSELLEAIRRCAAGEIALPARALRHLREDGAAPPGTALSPREIEVLSLLATGEDTKAIAEQLGLSVSTVRHHVQAILEKTDTHSKLEAVIRAIDAGLIPGRRDSGTTAY